MVVVGVNGSGKTTMSKVLTGAYLASSGTVSYDGQDMKALKRNSLYRHISLVTQDFVHLQLHHAGKYWHQRFEPYKR